MGARKNRADDLRPFDLRPVERLDPTGDERHGEDCEEPAYK